MKLLEVKSKLLSQVEGVTLVIIIELEALLEHWLGGPTAGRVQLALHLLDELSPPSYLYSSVSQLHLSDPCEGLALRYEKAPGT